jgi:hypothetical protein
MPATSPCPRCGAIVPTDSPQGICPACLLQQGMQSEASAAKTVPPAVPSFHGNFRPMSPEEVAGAFPQLEILEILGHGGMGTVYRARQMQLDRVVALKILPPEAAQAPGFAERFTREARSLAKLNHPHIVTVYDFGRAGPFYYFLMEFVDGVNVRQLIQQKQLKPAEALKIVPQICEALQYAHEEGIVHRDIKPENILLDRRGRVKIADFGLAKLLKQDGDESRLTGTGQVMGTWHYMAPEQLENPLGVDHRADIYSLGVVFYEMLTGELPLGRFALPSQKTQVDVRLDEVVIRTLEKEPERRYQHASEVKEQVEMITSAAAMAAGAVPDRQPERRASEQQSTSWMSGLPHRETALGQHVVYVIAAVLGAAATLLFIAMAFDVMDSRYALFGAIACCVLSAFVTSMGSKFFSGDPQAIVAGHPKLQAALAMSSSPEKDRTLADVAREAADEGESQVALLALKAIQDAKLRDETAATCALVIDENEGFEAAMPVARLIQEDTRRNEVLRKFTQ